MFPDIKDLNFYKDPYLFFSSSPNTKKETLFKWVEWLEKSAPWALVETNFYEQYEFSLLNIDLPSYIQCLASKETLSQLILFMEKEFNVGLSPVVDVVAHKLVEGQTIKIHNDFLTEKNRETHRILLQLNRGYEDKNGGLLMIFSQGNPESLSKVVEPINGSVQGFEISNKSHHAVSTVHSGERYTVVYSFREARKFIGEEDG